MAFGWSKTELSPIAIDFGFDSLKLLQIEPSDPPQLVAAATVAMPVKARHDVTARQEFYYQKLADLITQSGFKGRRATCSIPSYQTLVQNLQVSRSKSDSIESQISQYLRQRLNINPSRMEIRWFQEVISTDTVRQDLVCVAASRDVVMSYIRLAQRAKIDLVGMHCEPMAILSAFAYLFRRTGDETCTTCFIDIGAATSKVAIAHGAKLAFAKTIYTGANHLTPHYAQLQELEFKRVCQRRTENTCRQAVTADDHSEQCEDHAIAHSVSARCSDVMVLDERGKMDNPRSNKPVINQSEEITNPMAVNQNGQLTLDGTDALDCLIDELRLCVRYHRSVYPNRRIKTLVFLGGKARHVSTCQKVAQALQINAQLGDPLARMVRSSNVNSSIGVNVCDPQPAWAVPMGLCLCNHN